MSAPAPAVAAETPHAHEAPPGIARWVALATMLWLASGVYIVPADQQAVVTRFGRVAERRVMPGIHYSLPWPIDAVWKLKVQQMQRITIGGAAADGILGSTDPRVSQFFTGDQNLIQIRAVAQYSIRSPAEYLFRAANPGSSIAAAVESELTRRVARRGVDSVLTTEKAAVQEEVRTASQKLLDDSGVGVTLASVSIEFAGPPAEARDAFNDVASARADSARIVNEASGYANDVLPRARGEAESMLSAATAYRERRVNEAMGDADRFTQIAGEYAKAADVNGRRLYVETMEQILPKMRKLIVDGNGNVDLTILRKGEAAPR